jgi:hypothetical protein
MESWAMVYPALIDGRSGTRNPALGLVIKIDALQPEMLGMRVVGIVRHLNV